MDTKEIDLPLLWAQAEEAILKDIIKNEQSPTTLCTFQEAKRLSFEAALLERQLANPHPEQP